MEYAPLESALAFTEMPVPSLVATSATPGMPATGGIGHLAHDRTADDLCHASGRLRLVRRWRQ